MTKWIKTNFPGVRYREHPTRKNGVRRDQYFTIRYKINGKDKEEGLGWASENWTAAKAYDRLKELRENRKSGQGPQTLKEKRAIDDRHKAEEKAEQERRQRDAITFQNFFENVYLPQVNTDKKKESIDREDGLYKKWISPVFGHLPMKDVVPFHLEKLKKIMMDKGKSPRSIEYALAVTRQVFNTAKRLGLYDGENPTKEVKFPKPDNNRMRFMTRKEAKKLLSELKKRSDDAHDMTLLSLHCGLRFGEIAALTWQDVDITKRILTIRDAKAGSRVAFLTEQAAEMLENRKKGATVEGAKDNQKVKPADYIFPGRKGRMKRISPTFFRVVEDLELNKGIDDPRLQVCFHSCRHSYASWLIEQGNDLYTVQKLLGHKTIQMTARYSHLSENKLRDAAMTLSQALKINENETETETETETIIPLKN